MQLRARRRGGSAPPGRRIYQHHPAPAEDPHVRGCTNSLRPPSMRLWSRAAARRRRVSLACTVVLHLPAPAHCRPTRRSAGALPSSASDAPAARKRPHQRALRIPKKISAVSSFHPLETRRTHPARLFAQTSPALEHHKSSTTVWRRREERRQATSWRAEGRARRQPGGSQMDQIYIISAPLEAGTDTRNREASSPPPPPLPTPTPPPSAAAAAAATLLAAAARAAAARSRPRLSPPLRARRLRPQ